MGDKYKMRIYAKAAHPTHEKVERLIKFLQNELKLEVSFYSDRIFVKNMEIPMEKDWELIDITGQFINELPTSKYKLARDTEHSISKPRRNLMLPKNMEPEPIENN